MQTNYHFRQKQLKKQKYIRLICILLVLIYLLAILVTGFILTHVSASSAIAPRKNVTAQIKAHKSLSFLLLGVDQGIEGRHEQGNSDTLILATVNPAKKQTILTSIPRDLLTEIQSNKVNPDYRYFKVNSAYEVGNSAISVKTVSKLLNVPIDYYATINMKALKEIVNTIGGVTVQVPFSFSYDWNSFHKGEQHLNGRHAVAYVRMRHQDPRGDYGRQMRQRQVIKAITQKALKVHSLMQYKKLIDIFNKYAKTDLSLSDMLYLADQYRPCLANMTLTHIQGHDATINSSSMQVASTKELQKHSDQIRTSLNLPKEKLNNAETRINQHNKHLKWSDPTSFDNYHIN